jgi:hypothetical protein
MNENGLKTGQILINGFSFTWWQVVKKWLIFHTKLIINHLIDSNIYLPQVKFTYS